jgi:hypothetical protein
MVGGATYRSLYANHELSLVRIKFNRLTRQDLAREVSQFEL